MKGSKLVIYAALAGNLAIAISKLVAFAFTGSSAILTEAIHSFVDTGDQGLLLFGLHRAQRPPDDSHPFGYGLEVYFWSFVVALMIFALGGALSIWEGIHKIQNPETISRPWINFVVIGLAMVFEGTSFTIAMREFNQVRGDTPLLRSMRRSKDPNTFAVLLEDGAALTGLLVALAGVSGAVFLHLDWADGAASVVIGLLLVTVAVFLARETRSLLTGEAASHDITERVRKLIEADARVQRSTEVLSLHLGPKQILMGLSLTFRDDLSRGEMETAIDELTDRVLQVDDRINRVFLRPASDADHLQTGRRPRLRDAP